MGWLLLLRLAFDASFAVHTTSLRLCPHHVEVIERPLLYPDAIAPAPCDFLADIAVDAEAIAP